MGLLIFAFRKQDITCRKLDIEFKLTQMTEKLRNLQSYGSSISDGSVSTNDLMSVPPSLFGRMSSYMMFSHQASLSAAQQKMGTMSMMPGAIPQMENPQMQQQYSQMLMKNFYDQEREKFKKIEEKMLNEQDKTMQLEKNKLETQLKMLEAELTEVGKAEDASIKSCTPRFGLTG